MVTNTSNSSQLSSDLRVRRTKSPADPGYGIATVAQPSFWLYLEQAIGVHDGRLGSSPARAEEEEEVVVSSTRSMWFLGLHYSAIGRRWDYVTETNKYWSNSRRRFSVGEVCLLACFFDSLGLLLPLRHSVNLVARVSRPVETFRPRCAALPLLLRLSLLARPNWLLPMAATPTIVCEP